MIRIMLECVEENPDWGKKGAKADFIGESLKTIRPHIPGNWRIVDVVAADDTAAEGLYHHE
jgi:hypothetical protein